MNDIYTLKEAAAELGTSAKRAIQLVHDGRLVPIRKEPLLFDMAAIEACRKKWPKPLGNRSGKSRRPTKPTSKPEQCSAASAQTKMVVKRDGKSPDTLSEILKKAGAEVDPSLPPGSGLVIIGAPFPPPPEKQADKPAR